MNRMVDNQMIESIVGSQVSHRLTDLKTLLFIVQAAHSLSLEGINRATAKEISDKALSDYQCEVMPSFVGQVFASYSIKSVTVHGKKRFVLDPAQIEEVRKDVAAQSNERTKSLRESIRAFQDLPDRIKNLQEQWEDIQKNRTKERELITLINEARSKPDRLPYLEQEAEKIRKHSARVQELEKEIRDLNKKEKSLPELNEKKKSLEAIIFKHESEVKAKEQEVATREKQAAIKEAECGRKESELANRIIKLQKRLGWIELAELEQAVESGKKELDQLSRQLGEKRSLLDKLLHRKEGHQ